MTPLTITFFVLTWIGLTGLGLSFIGCFVRPNTIITNEGIAGPGDEKYNALWHRLRSNRIKWTVAFALFTAFMFIMAQISMGAFHFDPHSISPDSFNSFGGS